jgi:hypothetical protein
VRNFGKLLATLANPIASPLTIRRAARSLRVLPRLSDIRLREDLKMRSRFPQRLKPRCNGYVYGGTEVPPFQNGNALGQNGNAYDGTEVPPFQNKTY